MFQKAERKKAKLRLGLCGPSGSGKTWSALVIATGMGGRIAMIDTERRGSLYANEFNFDIEELTAPYSPDRYIAMIKEVEKSGYENLIIDSLSHAWVGEGGVLSIVEKSGGTFQQGWKQGTPKQNALVDAIVNSNLHVLITLRSKTEHVLQLNEKGKYAPVKMGLAPVQRDGLEYEFTMFMEINMDNIAHITKDNTQLYNQQFIKPDIMMGESIMTWLNSGKEAQIKNSVFYVNEIKSCQSLDDLKSKFVAAYNAGFGDDPKVVEAKDQRKSYLINLEDVA